MSNRKSSLWFFVLLVGTIVLGVYLRPPMPYELWEEQELVGERPTAARSSPAGQRDLRGGGGVGVVDFDSDGLEDLLFTRASPVAPAEDRHESLRRESLVLFRNLGRRRFVDWTRQAGLLVDGSACGLGVGDFDGDGLADVFVCRAAGDRLFLNRGGRFEEAGSTWGLSSPGSVGAAVADFDRDGRLDVYACGGRLAGSRGDALYLQSSPGRFSLVRPLGEFHGVAAAVLDADGDRLPDLCVTSPDVGHRLLLGDGSGNFRAATAAIGALGSSLGPRMGRGVASGDLDGDGLEEVVVAGGPRFKNACYSRDRQGAYRDVGSWNGLSADTAELSGWGVELLDVDNDGDLDVYVANGGHHGPEGLGQETGRERGLIYLNSGEGHFEEVGELFGQVLARPRNLRGVACADLDGDGLLDLVLGALEGHPLVLWNRLHVRHWLRVRSPSPEWLGARVELEATGGRQVRWIRRTTGCFASGEAVAHFGLGEEKAPVALRIHWPSGQVDSHSEVPVDREYVAFEGRATMSGR